MALRKGVVVLLAMVEVVRTLSPSTDKALTGWLSNFAPWVLITAAVYGLLAVPAVVRRLAIVRRVPLTALEVLLGFVVTVYVVFFVALAVSVEERDHGLSTVDDAMKAFSDGTAGLQPLMDAFSARESPPHRSWTPGRVVAAAVVLFNCLDDPSRHLFRRTQQINLWRKVRRAAALGTKTGEEVDEEALRAHLRAYLATQAATGEGGAHRGSHPLLGGQRQADPA